PIVENAVPGRARRHQRGRRRVQDHTAVTAIESQPPEGGPARRSPLLEASGLSKTFRRGPEVVQALHSIDLSIEVGEGVGLTGPSGSGKTTLLNVLCGWETPDEGEV